MTQRFPWILKWALASSDLCFRYWFCNLDLGMMVLLNSLVTNGEWFVHKYFILAGACLFISIQDETFWGYSRMGKGKKSPCPPWSLPHIYYNDETWHSYNLPIEDLKGIYESRDTPLNFCWYQHIFTGNQQTLLYYKKQI